MLAGIPVATPAVHWIALTLRGTGAHDLADRLDRAVSDDVNLLALTVPSRALMLAALEDPPPGLAEVPARGVEGI